MAAILNLKMLPLPYKPFSNFSIGITEIRGFLTDIPNAIRNMRFSRGWMGRGAAVSDHLKLLLVIWLRQSLEIHGNLLALNIWSSLAIEQILWWWFAASHLKWKAQALGWCIYYPVSSRTLPIRCLLYVLVLW